VIRKVAPVATFGRASTVAVGPTTRTTSEASKSNLRITADPGASAAVAENGSRLPKRHMSSRLLYRTFMTCVSVTTSAASPLQE
jgi:Flp pilus assembly protein TadG